MDPEACLLAAESCISDGEETLAADALNNYAEWRNNGGYEPTIDNGKTGFFKLTVTGDLFHRGLILRYELKFGPYLDGRLS